LNTEWIEVEVIDILADVKCVLDFGLIGSKSTGVIIRTIKSGSNAEQDGRLRVGDHLMLVDSVSVRGLAPNQIAMVIRQSIANQLMTGRMNLEECSIGNQVSDRFCNGIRCHGKLNIDQAAAVTGFQPTIKLTVARPAMGCDQELQLLYMQQQNLLHQHNILSPITLVPSAGMESHLELIQQILISNPGILKMSTHSTIGDLQGFPSELLKDSKATVQLMKDSGLLDKDLQLFKGDNTENEETELLADSSDESLNETTTESNDEELSDDECLPQINDLAIEGMIADSEAVRNSLERNPFCNLGEGESGETTDFVEFDVELEDNLRSFASHSKGFPVGMTIVGYVCKKPQNERVSGIFIKSLDPEGVAGRSKSLEIHDQLISVNDSDLLKCNNSQAVGELKAVGKIVKLRVFRCCISILEQLQGTDSRQEDKTSLHQLDISDENIVPESVEILGTAQKPFAKILSQTPALDDSDFEPILDAKIQNKEIQNLSLLPSDQGRKESLNPEF
ncbi:hypothetical protein Ciccas_001430, partial [Cichlidogyrus casuarinus]